MKRFGYMMVTLAVTTAVNAYEITDYTWSEYGGHWYAPTFVVGDWEAAQAEARDLGADLVSIGDEPENNWLAGEFANISATNPSSGRSVWIGMLLQDAEWQWISGEPVTYINICGPCFRDPGPHMYLHTAAHELIGTWNYNNWHDIFEDHYLHGVIELPDCNSNSLPDPCDVDCGTAGGACDLSGCGAYNDANLDGFLDICQDDVWYPWSGKIYKLTSHGTWDEAQAQAADWGGHLITINNEAENQFASWFARGAYVVNDDGLVLPTNGNLAWIGYVFDNGEWVWVNGEPVTYENRAGGWPSYTGIHAYVHGDNHTDAGTWNHNFLHDDPATPQWHARGIVEAEDCNGNLWPDTLDIASGGSADCNTNSIPDECEPDFDGDGTIDDCDGDIDNDGVPNESDVCDYTPTSLAAELIEPDGSVLGDLDGDCDVDLADYAIMRTRFTGPNPE